MKRPELLPHADFSTVEQIGYSGEKLKDYAGRIAARLTQIGGDDYRPRIHLDIYGTLGGSANETDQSARICTHIGLACRPDFMLSKPGLGVDEALMIQRNEMARTLALVASQKGRFQLPLNSTKVFTEARLAGANPTETCSNGSDL